VKKIQPKKGLKLNLPGPENITRVVLSNGITVLARTNTNSPSIVISGYLQAGSLFDPIEKLGLADFVSAALLRGTERKNFQQIFDQLESAGAHLGFNAAAHTASFSGRALAEDLAMLLGLLTDALQKPIFPQEQVEKLRAQLLTGLSIRAQDTADMAALTFDQILFADHPYSHPDDGWPETIQRITRDDLETFHQAHYGPRGMVISVVGAIDSQEIIQQVREALEGWGNPDQPVTPTLPELTPITKSINRKVKIPGKSQADIVIGTYGPRRQDADFMATALANSVLGQFGMAGRIGEVVREKSGLAYYAYSSLNAGIGPGSWDISAGVNPANVHKATDLVRKEIEIFISKGIKEEELADSQANFVGRLPLSLESNAGVANALLSIERFELGLDYYQRYPNLVQEVTPEQVMLAARKFLEPRKLAVAVAGP
jgi:zinc protease